MYLKIIMRGLFRRKKSAKNVFMAAFLSAAFMTLVLLYSDNMESYIRENNLNKSGNWFMAVKSPKNQDFSNAVEILNMHSYLDAPGYITDLYTLQYDDTELISGVCDERAFELARFDVLKGRLPSNDGEAVLTMSAFKSLGISYTYGMELDFNYNVIRETREIPIQIVGIIDDYSANWNDTIDYPQIIFSTNPFDTDKYAYTEAALYPIKDEYSGIEVDEFYLELNQTITKALEKTGSNARYIGYYFIYNSNAYGYTIWYTSGIARAVEAVVLIAGIIIILQVAYTYTMGRKSDYTRLYSLGASASQVMLCIFVENFVVCIIGQLAGIIAAAMSAGIILYTASLVIGINFFYIFKLSTCLKIVISCIAASSAAILPVAAACASRSNARRKKKHVMRCRIAVNYLFTAIMSTLIMLCAVNIYEAYIEYQNASHNDLVISMYYSMVPQKTEPVLYLSQSTMYAGITQDVIDEFLTEQTAVKKINRLSIDQMHTFSWNNMENSTFKKLTELYRYMWYNYQHGIDDITYSMDMDIPDYPDDKTYYDYNQLIIVDDCSRFFSMLDRLGIKIDTAAFERGESIVFCDGFNYANYSLSNYEFIFSSSGEFFLDHIPEELTISTGDTLYFDCYNDALAVTVGAKLSYEDVIHLPLGFTELSNMYTLERLWKNGYFVANDCITYHVICSAAFAEKLAAADGQPEPYTMKYNKIGIEYDHSQNYMPQLEQAMEAVQSYYGSNDSQMIFFNGENYAASISDIENNSSEVESSYSRYIQSTFVYSVFLLIICIMSAIIKRNMILLSREADKSSINRYILLGADSRFFRKRYFKASVKEILCILPGMLISFFYAYFISASDTDYKYVQDIAGACPFTPHEVLAIIGITAAVIILYIIISGTRGYHERNNKSR